MKYLGSKKILSALNVAITGTVDFQTNAGGAGVVLYVVTSNKVGVPNFTFNISALNPDGSVLSLITSAAVIDTNTTTRIAVLPGILAQINAIANEVIPGLGRFTYTRAAGSYNLDVWAAYFG
jgi:hypothetical protein